MPVRSTVVENVGAMDRLLRSPSGAVGRVLLQRALRVEAEVKRTAPADTGRLRQSVSHEIRIGPQGLEARVGTNVEYADYIEHGTGIYGPHGTPIVAANHTMLKFTSKKTGTIVFSRSVKGQRARHIFRDALLRVFGHL